MEIQTGVLAVLGLVAFIAFIFAIVGGFSPWGIWLKGWQRIAILIIGLLALYILLIGLGVLPKPFQQEPEVTPTITIPTETTSSEDLPTSQKAVQVLDWYYQTINNAANKVDFEDTWRYLSPEFQCSSSNCNMDEYKDFWWSVMVEYELFDCGITTVDVKLIYYNRGSGTPTGQESFLRYTFEEGIDNKWFIINGVEIEGSNCESYIKDEIPQ